MGTTDCSAGLRGIQIQALDATFYKALVQKGYKDLTWDTSKPQANGRLTGTHTGKKNSHSCVIPARSASGQDSVFITYVKGTASIPTVLYNDATLVQLFKDFNGSALSPEEIQEHLSKAFGGWKVEAMITAPEGFTFRQIAASDMVAISNVISKGDKVGQEVTIAARNRGDVLLNARGQEIRSNTVEVCVSLPQSLFKGATEVSVELGSDANNSKVVQYLDYSSASIRVDGAYFNTKLKMEVERLFTGSNAMWEIISTEPATPVDPAAATDQNQ